MAIYRGVGGSGDAVADTSNQSVTAIAAAAAAQASATAAASSANTAASRAIQAASSSSTAQTAANNASASAVSANTASSSANTSANSATTSANNAATSATNAGYSATSAFNSASSATTSATNAATSATNAAASATTAASYTPSQTGNAGKYLTTNGTSTSWGTITTAGTVTSVGASVPTGLSISGSPITTSGTLAITYAAGYSIPTTTSQGNWDTAFTDRLKWDGGATGLTAATGRTSLGLGSISTQASNSVSITGGSITGITDLTIADGGTGASTALAAYNNLSPMTTLGDIVYEGAGASALRLGIGSTNQVLTVVSGVPAWASIPTLNQNTTGTAANVTGIVSTANGGTGLSTIGTANQALVVNGAGTGLTYVTLSGGGGGSMTYPTGTGIAVVSGGTTWGTTLTAPTGTIVGTTDTQTLTNKTLTTPTIVGTLIEDVFTITDAAGFAIDPDNGSIQLITLGASRTPTVANFAAGEAVTLMINDGTAFTITWTTIGVVWVGGTAPTLATTGYTVIELWRVGSTYYGALVGNVA